MFSLLMQQQCHKYVNIYILNSVISSLDFHEKKMFIGIIIPAVLYGRILRILCFAFYEQKTSENMSVVWFIDSAELSQSFQGNFVDYSILCIARVRRDITKKRISVSTSHFSPLKNWLLQKLNQKAVKKTQEPHVHQGQGAETEMTQHFWKRVKA